MMMTTRLSIGVLAFVALLAVTQTRADRDDMDGRELYLTYQCWQCHGYEGQGGPEPRIASKNYPFDAFARFVRYPNLMPAYTPSMLSDEQLRRIYEFVISIPEPPSLEDIPALSEM